MNLSLTEKATRAMEQANARVIAEHHHQNRPLAIWQNGKVVLISATTIGAERDALLPALLDHAFKGEL